MEAVSPGQIEVRFEPRCVVDQIEVSPFCPRLLDPNDVERGAVELVDWKRRHEVGEIVPGEDEYDIDTFVIRGSP